MEIPALLADVDALRLRLDELLAQLGQLAPQALHLLFRVVALDAELVPQVEQIRQRGEKGVPLLDPARNPLPRVRVWHVGPRCPRGGSRRPQSSTGSPRK